MEEHRVWGAGVAGSSPAAQTNSKGVMKIIAKFDEAKFPPLLHLVIYDAPHYRMHWRVIQDYREHLRAACTRAGILTPIEGPIDLYVNFVFPSSTDNGNLYLALERAMDGKTLKPPGILLDDVQIQDTHIRKFLHPPKK